MASTKPRFRLRGAKFDAAKRRKGEGQKWRNGEGLYPKGPAARSRSLAAGETEIEEGFKGKGSKVLVLEPKTRWSLSHVGYRFPKRDVMDGEETPWTACGRCGFGKVTFDNANYRNLWASEWTDCLQRLVALKCTYLELGS